MPISPLYFAGSLTISEVSKLAAQQRAARVAEEDEERLQTKAGPLDRPIAPINTNAAQSRRNQASSAETSAERTEQSTADAQNESTGRFLRPQSDDASRELARLAPKRPNLLPSEEVALFAEAAGDDAAVPVTNPATLGEAVAEDGTPVPVEILTPENQQEQATSAQILTLAQRAFEAVSKLYAHNNDITFNSTPLSQLAA